MHSGAGLPPCPPTGSSGDPMRAFVICISLVATWAVSIGAWAADLGKISSTGIIKVAVYKEFAPFNDGGKGIDVDIAAKLAEKLGVRLSLLPFDADENMDDDLRNMVWRGHYLGYGPADVMMHVPVDRDFMERNKRVKIFAPYYREILQLVRSVERLPKVESIRDLGDALIGVEDSSIGSLALLAADGGRLTKNVRHYKNIGDAIREMREGRISAVLAMRSQLQAAMGGDWSGFQMGNPPLAGLPQAGWVLGMAVKSDNEDLARALQKAMNELEEEGQLNRIFDAHGVKRLQPL